MFLNLIMLAGIGGAAVPLVLHLLNRARYRTVDWGAMMFLPGDDARQRQSARLRQLILLLVRMALVALLAIALARPLIAARWNPGQDTPLTAVILLDRSGSMGHEQKGHPRLDLAREAVRQILSTLRRGDEAALIPLGDAVRGPAPKPTADLQSINDALSGASFIKPGFGTADIADGLTLAADVLDRARGSNRAIFVVCDRQALNWNRADARFAAAWRARISVPGPPPRFFVIPVGGEEADNVIVESIEVMAPEIVVHQSVDVEVTVHNYGPTARSALPVTISNNRDSNHDIKTTVNLGAKGSATIRQAMTFNAVGSQAIIARISTPGLSGDDQMAYAVDVVNPISVLIVSGEAHRGKQLNQVDYLKMALMPFAAAGRGGTDLAAVQAVTPTTSEDWADNLQSPRPAGAYRVVVLADIPEITIAQARAVEQYVYAGGGLLIAPGGLTQVEHLNSILYRDGAGILPAQLRAATPADGSGATTILGIELSHPLFRFLKGKSDPIPSAIVGRYFPTSVHRPEGRVLASFASGLPFVIEGKFGRGKVMLITSPLDGDWGTLPMTNFYLPLVQSAVRYLAARPSGNLMPGEPIIAELDDAGAARSALLTAPGRKEISIPLQPAGDHVEARYSDTREPGIYALTIPNMPKQTHYFVVQPSRAESDLTPMSAQQWSEQSKQLGFRMIEAGGAQVGTVLAAERARRELWPILLAGVLALALTEVALGKLWGA